MYPPRVSACGGSWMHRSSLLGMMSSIVVVLDALQSPSSGLRGLRAPGSVSSLLAFWSSVSTRTQQRVAKRGRRPVCLLLLNRLNKAIQATVVNGKRIVQRSREVSGHSPTSPLALCWKFCNRLSHDCGLPLGFQSPSSFDMMRYCDLFVLKLHQECRAR